MRRQLIGAVGLLMLVLMPQQAWAAISEVGAGTQRAETTVDNADSGALAFPANVGLGNLLIVAGVNFNTGAPTIAVTDSLGTSYTILSAVFGTNFRAFIAYGVSPSAGANTVTVDPTGIGNYMSFAIDEFSGQHATPLDVDGGSSTGQDTAPQDALTTLATGDLLVGVMGFQEGVTVVITPGTNYTQFGEEENNAAHTASNEEFRLVTTAQSYTVDWTLASAETWLAYTAAFKPAAGSGAGGPVGYRNLLGVGQ